MIHITKSMTGKMEGMVSINTSSLDNSFCRAMAKVKGSICERCYSNRNLKRYKNAREAFRRNGEILSKSVLQDHEIPKINAHTVRFNSYGELINDTHFINLCRIAQFNPLVRFTLWTKRMDLICCHVPKNLRIIQSSAHIDRQDRRHPKAWKVFTVYSDDKNINCGSLPCMDCMKCYDHKNRTIYIKEKLK